MNWPLGIVDAPSTDRVAPDQSAPPLVSHRRRTFHLLILDDLSYVQKDYAETSVLFELIAARYERRSIMITANQPFGGWDGIFPDKAMTVAAIDRLVHHAVIFEMNVESYRRRAALERATSKRDTASDIPNAQPKKDT